MGDGRPIAFRSVAGDVVAPGASQPPPARTESAPAVAPIGRQPDSPETGPAPATLFGRAISLTFTQLARALQHSATTASNSGPRHSLVMQVCGHVD